MSDSLRESSRDLDRSVIRYQCRECDDIHHPDDRPDHDFLLNATVCPSCGSKRLRVYRDFDGRLYR